MNNDRYFKIEVDFPAVLDEYFNVSTSKQRVDVSEKIWDKLKEAGIVKAISTLTGKYRAEKKEMDVERDTDDPTTNAPSEEAMEETAKVSAAAVAGNSGAAGAAGRSAAQESCRKARGGYRAAGGEGRGATAARIAGTPLQARP